MTVSNPLIFKPPFGYTQTGQLDSDSYTRGVFDAFNPLSVPEVPRWQPLATNLDVFIASDGSDSNSGLTPQTPVKTVQKAVTVVQANPGKISNIRLRSGQTHVVDIAMPRGWSGLFSSWGVGSLPLINPAASHNSPFWFGDSNGVQFFGLSFASGSANVEAGIVGNGLANLWVDSCTFTGFSFGIELTGSNNGGFRAYRNIIQDQFPNPTSLNHCSGIYIQGVDTWDVQGNAFYRCGLIPIDPNDPLAVSTQNQRHGIYVNQSGATGAGRMWLNLMLECAGSAVGCRRSISAMYNVIRGGSDYHIIAGNEQESGTTSVVSFNAIFGPATDSIPLWGAGISLISDTSFANMNYFSSSASVTVNPCITVKRGVATLMNNRGWWRQPFVNVNAGASLGQATGNNTVKTGVPVGSPVPTLAGFPLNVGASVVPSILDWMDRSTR